MIIAPDYPEAALKALRRMYYHKGSILTCDEEGRAERGILNRTSYRPEYESVVGTMENLGFRKGRVQDMDSYRNYSPDFRKENPFA
jgi:hypothetical protein